MAIRATLSSGIACAKTTSLFQWDYGQQLEIVSDDLPSIVEVHFACKGMSEAVVRPCSITDGTGIVTIPDSCLEQSTDITAWVYSIEGTQGKTVKTITIPIVARIRPGRSETIPQGFSDQYTELISQINDAIRDLKDGTVTVKKAETADMATKATSATNASFANSATSADKATSDKNGKKIDESYLPRVDGFSKYKAFQELPYGLYVFKIETWYNATSEYVSANLVVDVAKNRGGLDPYNRSPIFYYRTGVSTFGLMHLNFVHNKASDLFEIRLESIGSGDSHECQDHTLQGTMHAVYYKCLSVHAVE